MRSKINIYLAADWNVTYTGWFGNNHLFFGWNFIIDIYILEHAVSWKRTRACAMTDIFDYDRLLLSVRYFLCK